MLESAGLIAFVAVKDLDRAREFYEGILGLRLVREDGFALAFDAQGTVLRVTQVDQVEVAPYTVLGWTCDDIAIAVAGLAGHGVSTERFESMGQDTLGIWTSPSGDLVAWFKDPDGNTLSLTQPAHL